MICFIATGVFLAFQYEKEEKNPWDDRDKNSKMFCYENKDRFLTLFEEKMEFMPVLDIKEHFNSHINHNQFKGTPVEGWYSELTSEHPTLRQSYIRGFSGLLAEDLGLNVTCGFPMI